MVHAAARQKLRSNVEVHAGIVASAIKLRIDVPHPKSRLKRKNKESEIGKGIKIGYLR